VRRDVARFPNVPVLCTNAGDRVVADGTIEFVERPYVEGAFFVFGIIGRRSRVGVLGSMKATMRRMDGRSRQVGGYIVDSIEVEGAACHEPRIEVQGQKLSVVVKPM